MQVTSRPRLCGVVEMPSPGDNGGVGVDTGSRVFSLFYVGVRGQPAIATRRELSSADGN